VNRPIQRAAAVALRVIVFAAALLFLARGVAWRDVAATLRGASASALVGVIGLNAVMMAVKAARLRLLLPGARPSFRSCFLAKLTSSAINNVTPLRGGDVARVWMLERHAGVTKSAAAAVAVVEALFELLALAVIASGGALLVTGERWAESAAPILLAVAIALFVVLYRVGGRGPVGSRPADAAGGAALAGISRLWVRLRAFADRIEPGLRALRQPGTVALALALSLCAWALETGMVVLCARSIHLAVGPALAVVVLLGINLAMALPSLPASVGAFEGAAALVLILAGIPKGPAVAFALLYHVIQIVPVTIVGMGVVSRVGITLGGLGGAIRPETLPGAEVGGVSAPNL
jgi:uncharacterized protein (TIRG00374 family)